MERFSSLLQLLIVLVGGVWFCYRGTTFSDPAGHAALLPAAMAILTGLTVIMVVIFLATMHFFNGRAEA